MSQVKTEGIVLRRSNFGEADRVITFLTPDRGKVRAVAKGVRRIKSRMAGHLELFGSVEIMLASGRNLDVITSARLTRSADSILADYERVGYGYLFAEMTDRLLEDEQSHPELYASLTESYEYLAEQGVDRLVELFFKLRLLDALGYWPHLSNCTVCHQEITEQFYFAPIAGGVVDAGCTTDRSLPMSVNQIKLWRLVLSNPLDKLRKIAQVQALAEETLAHCHEFYDYTFGKRFRTHQFLARVP